MKTKFISLLVSILYLPLLIIGQFIGNIIGSLLTPIIKTFDLLWISWIINFISDILFMLIGGVIGGLICGFIISKIYKSFNFFYVSIFPWSITLLYVIAIFLIAPSYGQEISMISFGDAGACLLSVIFFHIYLRDKEIN